MRSLYATLSLLARHSSEGPARSLFASLFKAAGANEDLVARASYLEGLMGAPQNSLTRNPRQPFKAAYQAVLAYPEGISGDPIVDALRGAGMGNKDIMKMVGDADQGVFESLVWGARKGMGRIPSFRGITPEGIAQALSVGVSPLTLDHHASYRMD